MPSRKSPAEYGDIKPLSGFTRLGRKVSLYTPSTYGTIPPSPHDPTTILFCSWMNGAPKHIDYYCKNYMRLYPSARIILSTINTTELFFHSESRRQADVREAVSVIPAPGYDNERLFVHALSNGGAKRMFAVAGAYQALTGKPLPAKAFLLESAPGIPKFRRDIHTLAIPAERWPLYFWLPYMAMTLVVVSVVYVVVNWMPNWVWHDLVWRPTFGMNDPKYVPLNCVRGYIYSKEDLVMDWKDVENHAKVAEEKGYVVRKKLVEGADHAKLFKGKGGEKDYWKFITNLWDLGMEDK